MKFFSYCKARVALPTGGLPAEATKGAAFCLIATRDGSSRSNAPGPRRSRKPLLRRMEV